MFQLVCDQYWCLDHRESLIEKGCKINHQLNEFHEKRVSILQPRFPFVVFRLFHLDIYWPFVLLAQVLYQEKHY